MGGVTGGGGSHDTELHILGYKKEYVNVDIIEIPLCATFTLLRYPQALLDSCTFLIIMTCVTLFIFTGASRWL